MDIHSSDSFTKHERGSNYPAIIGSCQGQKWREWAPSWKGVEGSQAGD